MMLVAVIGVTVAGCAAGSRRPLMGPPQSVLLEIHVASEPAFSVLFEDDRTVKFSSGNDLRYAKLT
ncbi:MAG TPA: hypothetical protein VF139_15820, partial [Candidatus Polarisedimenticolaceae bacterium]